MRYPHTTLDQLSFREIANRRLLVFLFIETMFTRELLPSKLVFVGEGTSTKNEGTVPFVFGWHALRFCS